MKLPIEKYDGKARLEWPDVCRGIAILWVVLVHCNTPYSVFDQFVIAAFFFVSGFVTSLEKGSFLGFVWHKFRAIFLPFLASMTAIWLLLVLPLQCICPAAQVIQPYLPEEGIREFLKVFFLYGDPQLDVLGATWFLMALFFGLILTRFIVSVCRKMIPSENLCDAVLLVISLGIMIAGVATVLAIRHHRWFLDLSLLSQFFIVLGWLCRRRGICTRIESSLLIQTLAFILTSAIIWWFSFDPPHLPFAHGVLSRGIALSTFAALNGILAIVAVSMLLVQGCVGRLVAIKNVLIFVGRNSMGILLFHFLAFKFVYLILWPLGVLGPSEFSHVYPQDPQISHVWWPLFVLIGSIVPIFIWRVVQGVKLK